jgi:hypothetical protein
VVVIGAQEAVFQSLIGVEKVEQGWIASDGSNADF